MSRVVTVQEVVNAERFAFVPGRNWLVTCDADGTIPLNSRIVAEFVKEPPAELIAAMEALPELLAACKAFMNCGLIVTDGHTTDSKACNCTCRVHPELDAALESARAAIARAEGGAA